MFIVIDSGSTQTRLYLVEGKKVIAEQGLALGINSGGDIPLKIALAEAITQFAVAQQINLSDIRFIVASGMITSNLGLLEVPHITAPANAKILANAAVRVHDPDILPLDVELIFIPGIKNQVDGNQWSDLHSVDLMRGEETQAISLAYQEKYSLPCTVVELGSTTKIIHIDEKKRISGSLTSLSGQVYSAIKKETFIGASMERDGADPIELIPEIVEQAWQAVNEGGMLRALLLTRFSQFSVSSTPSERDLYCQAVLAADDCRLFQQAQQHGFPFNDDVILVGNAARCRLYHWMLTNKLGMQSNYHVISQQEEINKLAVTGAIIIADYL